MVVSKCYYKKPHVFQELYDSMVEYLDLKYNKETHIPVVFNIGTDSSSGDSLGPMVGWILKQKKYKGLFLGDLENPIDSKNIEAKTEECFLMAEKLNKVPFIIAIDGCLGLSSNIGYICIKDGGLKSGLCLGCDLPSIGDVHILGIVNERCGTGTSPFYVNMHLAMTRLHIVVEMSLVIADFLCGLHDNYFSIK